MISDPSSVRFAVNEAWVELSLRRGVSRVTRESAMATIIGEHTEVLQQSGRESDW